MINIMEISIEEFQKDIYDKYIELFPVDEQRSWSKIERTYRDGVEHFYKICLDDKIIGFILLEKIDDAPYYMDYFAIYKEYQNKGYGSKTIKCLIDSINSSGLMLEIEKIDRDNPLTIKRLEFYKKLGFVNVESEYSLYGVSYTPMVYLSNIDKSTVDEMFFKYYTINVGKIDLEKNCRIVY